MKIKFRLIINNDANLMPDEIGNDVNRTSSWLTPSIVFEGVDFSGI